MEFTDCIAFASECRIAFVATIDDEQPRVRPLTLQYADATGFYFQTEPVKRLFGQLANNSRVEVCFYRPEEAGLGTVLRVSGEVEMVDDEEIKSFILRKQPFLKKLGINDIHDPLFVVFGIKRGEAYFWTYEQNMKETDIKKLYF